ncbi:MAG: NUDIX hydrolase [Dehalococcoidia bacterium]|nr:NUDIX hydrolase [Dehalococcoidia bacterium]MDW8120561.1 NUDIX hydrolase [Chloroflexota bacterium]
MAPDPSIPWEVLERREVVSAPPWVKVWVERVRLPSGRIIEDFWQLALLDYAVVVPQTADGAIVLVRLYRHGPRRTTLALPGGFVEAGENPLTTAQRELREETGYTAPHWQALGSFFVDGNRGQWRAHLFRAWPAQQTAPAHPDDTEALEVVLLKRQEALQALWEGRIALLPSAAALALALLAPP